MHSKTVFMLGIGSDIGRALAKYYLQEGYIVSGTYRHKNTVDDILENPNMRLFQCDISDEERIKEAIEWYRIHCEPWNIFISCIGSMEPIGNFFSCTFETWEQSVVINSIAQLRFLHGIYPYKRKGDMSHVVFFAGGGTNGPFKNYSAYCASKIFLIKMCELLDDENEDLDIFIIGPGWVRTKIHGQTIKHSREAGKNFERTVEFMKDNVPGTSYKDIFECINWCIEQGKHIASGRNFSVVHDPWKQDGSKLSAQLHQDSNKFKLRRFRSND